MRTRVGAALVVVGMTIAPTGCGGDDPEPTGGSTPEPSPSASSTPTEEPATAPGDRCYELDGQPGLRETSVSTTAGELYAVEAGRADRVLVLVHGSGSVGLCVWTRELSWLVDAGYRVIALDLPCVGYSECPDKLPDEAAVVEEAVAALRSDGAVEVAVVAASAGGPLAIDLALDGGSGAAAAVALSPAGLELEAADPVQVPLLVGASRDDGYLPKSAFKWLAELGGNATLVSLAAGAGHAQEILYAGGNRPSGFREQMLDFLDTHLPRGR